MKALRVIAFVFVIFVSACISWAQSPGDNPAELSAAATLLPQHHSRDVPGSIYTLDEIERIAEAGNPEIRVAARRLAVVQAHVPSAGALDDPSFMDRGWQVPLRQPWNYNVARQSPVVSLPLQPISFPGALPIPSLHSFTTSALMPSDDGALWAAGIGPQVLLKFQNNRIVTQVRDQHVDCAYPGPNGALWFATPRYIFRLTDEHANIIGSKKGAVTYSYDSALPAGQGLTLRRLNLPRTGGITVSLHSRVKAITQDRLGRLWIAGESGTFRLENSSWTSLESLGGPQGTATAELTDSEGRIWFGFANAVAMLDQDRVRIFSCKDGLQIGTVTSIQSEGTKIWVGGEFGLEFFDGSRFQPVNPSNGGAFSGVSGIVADRDEGLWFSETRGIIHVGRAQLQEFIPDKSNSRASVCWMG